MTFKASLNYIIFVLTMGSTLLHTQPGTAEKFLKTDVDFCFFCYVLCDDKHDKSGIDIRYVQEILGHNSSKRMYIRNADMNELGDMLKVEEKW